MSVAALQEAMARVCLSRAPSEGDLAALEGGAQRERFLLYRDMVRSRITDLVIAALPRTAALLPRASLLGAIDDWLAAAPPATRFFRELPLGLVDHAMPEWRDDAEHPHLADLARLERAQWEANWSAKRADGPIAPFDLEKVPVTSATLVRLETSFAVHLPEEDPRPRAGRFFLTVHRRPDHLVETRWMGETEARLVREWHRGDAPAIEGVRRVLAEEGRAADAAFVDRMTTLLAALLEGGAILGSRP